MQTKNTLRRGFTLIELSVVLVIIGLIVGGVLAGQSLIAAAGVRAQISQIEKFQTAMNTFRGKFGYLPGDIKDPLATSVGLLPRGPNAGQGDGNGLVEGYGGWANSNGGYPLTGEAGLFWRDLSAAHLIEGNFTVATATGITASVTATSTPSLADYIPAAKIGGSNSYVYVTQGMGAVVGGTFGNVATNYFTVGPADCSDCTSVYGAPYLNSSGPSMTVAQAYALDSKIDDGLPELGNVLALYQNSAVVTWQDLFYAHGGLAQGPYLTTATVGDSTTCFDNNGTIFSNQRYSVQVNKGLALNCAVSIRFQ